MVLTRLPMVKISDGDFNLKDSLWAFPLVGAALALVLYLAAYLMMKAGFDAFIGAVILVFLSVILTGALHEDGLADCADALGVQSVDQRLVVMRDSQIGTYGTLALLFSVLMRIGAVFLLWDSELLFIAILLSFMASRGAMVLLLYFSKPAREDGLSAVLKNLGFKYLAIGQSIILAVGVMFIGVNIVGLMLVGLAIVFLIARYSNTKFGGFTGDVLGATEQIVQIICLLLFALFV